MGVVSPVEEGHHLVPEEDGAVLFEEFASEVLFPILQPLQLVGEHLPVYHFPLRLNLAALGLQYLCQIAFGVATRKFCE